ncbi:alpha/beta fold hydrolase [Chloroflexota bacterium]
MILKFETIETNGIHLHTVLAGPGNGQPVFLLHGFPDAWFGWQSQIEALVGAGFRVIAPDQRGYNLSDKPQGIASYTMPLLVDDILGLADELGFDRFSLAGHDFGAMVAWNLAMSHPERLKKMAIANVPHPAVMKSYLRSQPKQMLKSWYGLFFQIPKLPELIVRMSNWRFLISAMPDELSAEEQDRYREVWEQPGAMTGMINWYRAMLQKSRTVLEKPNIKVPTLILWGKQDPHLSYEMAELSVDLCDDGELITFEDASHWVLYDEPDEISKHLIHHFAEGD